MLLKQKQVKSWLNKLSSEYQEISLAILLLIEIIISSRIILTSLISRIDHKIFLSEFRFIKSPLQ